MDYIDDSKHLAFTTFFQQPQDEVICVIKNADDHYEPDESADSIESGSVSAARVAHLTAFIALPAPTHPAQSRFNGGR